MAMLFWEAQRRARSRTKVYLIAFFLMTLFVAAGCEWAFRTFQVQNISSQDSPYGALYEESSNSSFPVMGGSYLAITYLVALFQYLAYRTSGGGYVARQLGARQIDPSGRPLEEQRLYHLVEEMSIASGMPMPEVYVLDVDAVNAFAAGLKQDRAAITVTRGALRQFNRQELQGVIAHEFGHIYNGDMKISLRLAAMLMGFFIVLYLGLRLLQSVTLTGRRNRQGGNPIALAAIILVVAGAVTWFFGALLRAMVSREREYLADACAVQFTRSSEGISNALRKLQKLQDEGMADDMPKQGMAYAHLYFSHRQFFSGLFATHPPLKDRIAAIEGHSYDPGKKLNADR